MIHRRTIRIALLTVTVWCGTLALYLTAQYLLHGYQLTLADRLHDYRAAEQYQESLKEIERMVGSTAAQREELVTRILKDEDVIDFLTLVEMVSREQGVTPTTESISVSPSSGRFEHLLMKLKVVGTYEAIRRTIALLETMPYQVVIESVTLNTNADAIDTSWSAAIELKVTKWKQE